MLLPLRQAWKSLVFKASVEIQNDATGEGNVHRIWFDKIADYFLVVFLAQGWRESSRASQPFEERPAGILVDEIIIKWSRQFNYQVLVELLA